MSREIILHQETKEKISGFRFLKYLTEAECRDFLDSCVAEKFQPEERIIEEGETSSALYLVLAGAVNVSVSERTDDGTGKEVFICALGEGDFFGEAALFMNKKRTAHVSASGELLLLKVERESFIGFIRCHPHAGIKLLMLIIYSLLAKLREANQELAFERKASINQNDVDDIINAYLGGG